MDSRGNRISCEIQEIKKSLEKAVKTNESFEKIIDILQALENIKMTPALIKESKLGKTLAALRSSYSSEKSDSPDICNLARDIMVNWKKIVEEQGSSSVVSSSSSSVVKDTIQDDSITNDISRLNQTLKLQINPELMKMKEAIASYPEGRRKVSHTLQYSIYSTILITLYACILTTADYKIIK